jgi:hypothetical protein
MDTSELLLKDTSDIDRYSRHAAAIDFLGKIAKNIFSVDLSDKTLRNWTLANLLIKDVDSVFDGTDENAKASTVQILKKIFGPEAADQYLVNGSTTQFARELRHNLDDKQSELFLKRGLQIIALQNELRAETDPKKYGQDVLLEGQMQASMFTHIVAPEDKKQPNYNRFESFFLTAAGLANLYDSSVDLNVDRKEGQTVLSPTMDNRKEMLVIAQRDIKKALSYLSLKQTASFVRPVIEIARDRKRTPSD